MNAETVVDIQCPYCGEIFAISLGIAEGQIETIEDCMVCCRPVHIIARLSGGECVEFEVGRS